MERVVVYPESKTIIAFEESESKVFLQNITSGRVRPEVVENLDDDMAVVSLGPGLCKVLAKKYGPVTLVGDVSTKSGIKLAKIIYRLIKGEFSQEEPVIIGNSAK